MKRPSIGRWLPFGVYLCLLCGALAHFWIIGPSLTGRVATHFDISGQPNGWMSAEQIRTSYLAFLFLFPLLTPAICLAIRAFSLPISVPNKAYWSQPEQRRDAANFLLRTSFWVSAAEVAFAAVLFDSVQRANSFQPPRLEAWLVWLGAVILIGAVVAWIVAIAVYFSKSRPEPEGWRD